MSDERTLQQIVQERLQDNPLEIKGVLGRADGQVKSSGNEVYVTLMNGDVIEVYNDHVPRIAWRKIVVGYDDRDPSLLQVLRFDNVYNDRPVPMVSNHKETHAWYAHDPIDVYPQQFLPLLPRAAGGLNLRIYGGEYRLAAQPHVLPTTDYDLSAEVPTTGAEWVNVEVDAAGVVTYNHGSSLAGRELLTPEDIPATDPALKLLCSVKMYAGQSDIIQTRSSTDIYDPRFAGVESVWGYITGTLTDQADLQAALNAKLDDSQLDTDGTLAANSDSKIATQKATKTYVDNAVTGLLEFKGSTNASTNPNYPSASKGDAYVVSTAGKVGGSSGKAVDIGDVYLAIADNAGGTEASVGTSWIVLEHNLAGALLSANNLSDVANTTTARSNLGLVIGTDVQAHDADLDAIAGLTPSNDDIIQRKAGAWVGRSIAQLITDLTTGLSALFAPVAKGVTNGDSHDHNGGDGGTIAHGSLSSIGSNTHAQIDTHIAASGMELIQSFTLGSAAANFDLTSIPATYKHLKLVFSLRSASAGGADEILVVINNDTGANYESNIFYYYYNAQYGTQAYAGGTALHAAYTTANGALANSFGGGEISIFDYANANKIKYIQTRAGITQSVAIKPEIYDGSGIWNSTAAINRLTIKTLSTANWMAQSEVSLYGLK